MADAVCRVGKGATEHAVLAAQVRSAVPTRRSRRSADFARVGTARQVAHLAPHPTKQLK